MSLHPRHHGLSSTEILCLILNVFLLLHQGKLSAISVIQEPSVIVSEIEKNITLNCLFTHTPEQKVTGPILYWYYGSDELLYPHPIPQYKNRVIVLNPDKDSSNRSILLLNVQWEDNRKFHCMLSYEKSGHGARTRGKGVKLLLHGPMMFNVSSESENDLLCNITVSSNSGFHLTVLCNGVEVAKSQSEIRDKFTVLSALVHEHMECECCLNLDSTVVLSRSYIRKSKEDQRADLPEPVFLYAAILSIPFSITLIMVIVFPIFGNRKSKQSKRKP
ncbi:uncharacterized protein LOC108919165 [Scleropages formosus]|uniref:uncharacterized protein LOC108919165 n=1 Tax=Scleropages formosus TaxID=113540 RepID=UPI000878DA6D|nr:uncharacterized protein LOC108919165 [Scleropages formosus]